MIFHVTELDEEDWTVVDGLPVTTAIRTLTDLARVGHEPEHLIDMIGHILQRGLATRAEMADALVDNADIFGITPATALGALAWLEEQFPISALSLDMAGNIEEGVNHPQDSFPEFSPQQLMVIEDIVEKAVAPIREQIRNLLDATNSSPGASMCEGPRSHPLPPDR